MIEAFSKIRGTKIPVSSHKGPVPCIETSDAERLCKAPVVSVHMITYNHEAYIRQAIEGVVMQKTDFEYELVIGEDCSQDKTREICFEYQKRYPEKIRVLWWHENVSKLGGNATRVTAHCRGEYIALCEGDDYWSDPTKLQRQVDAFRANPTVGLCFAQAHVFNEASGRKTLWSGDVFPEGFIPGRKFFMWLGFGKTRVARKLGPESFIMTATVMMKRTELDKAVRKYDIFQWRLLLGDSITWLGIVSLSDVYFLKSPVSVYRQNTMGITSRAGARISRDGLIVRMYYAVKVLGVTLDQALDHLYNEYAQILFCCAIGMKGEERSELIARIKTTPELRRIYHRFRTFPLWILINVGWLTPFTGLWGSRWVQRLPMTNSRKDVFNAFYDEVER